ncbi:hypothetical protein [Fundidesulfovibrio putealis]|uniref:hypothetical protein n=1 Tax=Fundidesulfovibrio putealis TaxID=270496 RepID=UPI0004201D51|nr:hypothetical protein [Fundidesulfovibrio putealis]
MKLSRSLALLLGIVMLASMFGCQTASRNQVMAVSATQVELRNYQSRRFETENKEKTLRTVISTLQDLGFIIDKADMVLGSVSGTKLGGYSLRMTVTVRPKAQNQMVVRANAQYNLTAVEDPEPYQQFFASLEKSMFLQAHMDE